MSVSDYVQFAFDDGTSVLVEVFPTAGAAGPGESGVDGTASVDLPAASPSVGAVSRIGDTVEKAGRTLAEVLRPLIPVLDSVHQTVSKASQPPDEITVELGLKLSSELHLVLVGGNGETGLTVSAKWNLRDS